MADVKRDVAPLLKKWAHRRGASKRFLWAWNIALMVAFAVTQAVLLLILASFGAFGHSALSLRACLSLLVVFASADAVLLSGFVRSEILMNEERKIPELEQALEKRVREYEDMHAEMRRIARLRHDARNHLQVIASLSEKGEYDAARQMARSVAHKYLKEHLDE